MSLSPKEHYAEGERLLALADDQNTTRTIEQRTSLAVRAQAHFVAAMAAPRPVTSRETLIAGGFEVGS